MADKVQDALKVQGCQTKYKLINGTYERLPGDHNGKAAFVTRDANPCYCFHTGKARWVISKRIDDGQRCYAFRKDDPASDVPWNCTGPWVMANDQNEWSPDAGVTCSKVPGSDDLFIRLRLSLEDEMTKLGLVKTDNLKQLWRRLDFNGNNVVSLAEFDKLVVEMTQGGAWPDWLNNKPALMRAFTKAKAGIDGKRDDFVEKCEFHDLLLNMFWFNKLYSIYEDIDTDHDRRISQAEFKQGFKKLGMNLSEDEASKVFNEIDTDHGGMVLFVEFCAYVRKRVNPDDNPAFDTDIVSGEKAGQTIRKKLGNQGTANLVVKKKNVKMFDDVEAPIKKLITDNNQEELKKMWQHLDFNGNNVVSLAEIDKFVVESYEVLNHKPALMRAYKRTIQDGHDDDEFCHKKDFKALLGNIFYFNKLFWLFDSVDDSDAKDRRMTAQEFKICLVNAGMKVNETRANQYFKEIDKNGGGFILFDEFCAWFAQKSCPEAMTAFIEDTPGGWGTQGSPAQGQGGYAGSPQSPQGRR